MVNSWEQPPIQMQKKESEKAEKNLKLEINEKQEIFDKAEIMLKISRDDEKTMLEKKKYPEDLIVRTFANIREMLKISLKIMTNEGIVDWNKYGEEAKRIDLADPYERYKKEEELENSVAVKRFWSNEDALASIIQETKDINEHSFLGISVNERNIGHILEQDVYRGFNNMQLRRILEEKISDLSGVNKDNITTYGQIVDDRMLDKSKTHGHIIFKLNPSVASRTIFFIGDSLSGYGFPEFLKRQVKNLNEIDSALKRQILPEHAALGKALLNLGTEHRYFGQDNKNRREETYLEGDINGSINLESDIEEVLLDEDVLNQMNKKDQEIFEQRFKDKIKITKNNLTD